LARLIVALVPYSGFVVELSVTGPILEWNDEEFWRTKESLAWLYNEAPNRDEVVVNDRWARGMPGHHGDCYSSEYQDAEGIGVSHPWEESRGMGRS